MQNLQNLANVKSLGSLNSNASAIGFLLLSGSAANYASTADKASLDVSAGIDIIVCLSLNDWTPAAANTALSKYNTAADQRAYRLEVLGTGNLALGLSLAGTAVTTANSGAATGFSDGTAHWIRATWRSSDGRVQFFTSNNAPNALPSSWTQLGTDQTAAIASIFNSSAALMVGRQETAAAALPMTGRVYRAVLKDSIDGTIVADFNPQNKVGQTTWADDYSNTWALAGAAAIVK